MNIIKIVALDPGLNNTGVSSILFDYNSRSIVGIAAYTIKTEDLIKKHYMTNYLDDRTIKQLMLKEKFIETVEFFKPDVVISEAPFFYSSKPVAFKALVEVINLFKMVLAESYPQTPFVQLEPLMVKKHVKSLNIHDKDSTKEALEVLGLSKYLLLNTLDEHAVDAISIGYAFLKSRDLLL
jgi:Holliday junction resolvasome RuvABC endonuclease subunit